MGLAVNKLINYNLTNKNKIDLSKSIILQMYMVLAIKNIMTIS